jgi:hypothetical protein
MQQRRGARPRVERSLGGAAAAAAVAVARRCLLPSPPMHLVNGVAMVTMCQVALAGRGAARGLGAVR